MAKWIPSWRYVPINYNQELAVLEDVTQTCIFSNNIGGEKIRLRFNNLYSSEPMVISGAAVALFNRVTGRVSPRKMVTLAGAERIVIPADSRPYSDEIALHVTPQDDFLVYLYFGEKTVVRSVCTTATGIGWQSVHQTGSIFETEGLGFTIKSQLAPVLANDPYPPQFAAGICEVSVLAGDDVKLIALFGDSITHMSFFMDPFLERLSACFPGRYAVMNAGIAGNRIQKPFPRCEGFPGEGYQFGIAGKDRFYADVYDGAKPDIVFVMEGVNDCSHSLCFLEPEVPTAQDIFDALADVVQQAHARGSLVYLSTIAPFGAFADSWRDAAEELRCGCNEMIRQSQIADGILDMDAVLRDPDDPHRMQAGLHMGDGVHPNWRGGARMAQALMNTLFES